MCSQVLSASGDKTCKIWDVESRKSIRLFKMGDEVGDQQLACLWNTRGDRMISVSLTGNINFLDAKSPGGTSVAVQGHNRPITVVEKMNEKNFYTGDSDGRIIQWDSHEGKGVQVVGDKTHAGYQVNSMCWDQQTSSLLTVGIDDCVRKIEDAVFTDFGLKLPAQPRGVVAASPSTVFIATVNSIIKVKEGEIVDTEIIQYEASCMAVSPKNGHLVVGEARGHSVHVYKYSDGQEMEEMSEIKLLGQPTALAYSPDEKFLTMSDSNRRVTLLKVGAPSAHYEKAHSREWGFHSARVNCLAWAPNGQFIASGGLDCAIIIWSVDNPQKHFTLSAAHVQSQINGISWLDNATIVSVGQDGNVKIWNVTWKP